MVTNSANEAATAGAASGAGSVNRSPVLGGRSTGGSAGGGAWAGWIVFAGSLLLMFGVFQVIEGLFALFDDERVVVVANRLIGVDLTGWGWTVLLSGVLMSVTGVGLLATQTWARIVAIVVVGLHAVSQVFWLSAYPLWSVLMLALDTTVIFALTVRWSAAVDEVEVY